MHSCLELQFPCIFAMLKKMKVYYCNAVEYSDLCGTEYLAPARKARMARMLRREDQARCLAAGLLLRAVLGAGYDARLETGPHGKPYLRDSSVFFNLSHSGQYVVLGVGPAEIGVDVEQIRPRTGQMDRIARRCFTAAEQDWLERQPGGTAFYALWTAKESVMKATGAGFSMPPESFCVLPIASGPHTIGRDTWFLRWHMLDGHALCAAAAQDAPLELIGLGRQDLLKGDGLCIEI